MTGSCAQGAHEAAEGRVVYSSLELLQALSAPGHTAQPQGVQDEKWWLSGLRLLKTSVVWTAPVTMLMPVAMLPLAATGREAFARLSMTTES